MAEDLAELRVVETLALDSDEECLYDEPQTHCVVHDDQRHEPRAGADGTSPAEVLSSRSSVAESFLDPSVAFRVEALAGQPSVACSNGAAFPSPRNSL
jgi:hypothetical protein